MAARLHVRQFASRAAWFLFFACVGQACVVCGADPQHKDIRVGPPARALPAGPAEAKHFGAFYTRLSYDDPAWEKAWRVGDHPDVLVTFDAIPVRFVFWRGTSMIPCWVSENGVWYTNEFVERSGGGTQGCAEPMSDKQCRYSHVRIIENTPARVVIHWRYAPADVFYKQPWVDAKTGWGDWVDEYYTVYPDGVGVRKLTHHSFRIIAVDRAFRVYRDQSARHVSRGQHQAPGRNDGQPGRRDGLLALDGSGQPRAPAALGQTLHSSAEPEGPVLAVCCLPGRRVVRSVSRTRARPALPLLEPLARIAREIMGDRGKDGGQTVAHIVLPCVELAHASAGRPPRRLASCCTA